jgi:hypothetical protein
VGLQLAFETDFSGQFRGAGFRARMTDYRMDIALSGHLHSWRADLIADVEGRSSILQVQAGTSLSNRLRGEMNDFNLLEIEAGKITVNRHAFSDDSNAFCCLASVTFIGGLEGWRSEGAQ